MGAPDFRNWDDYDAEEEDFDEEEMFAFECAAYWTGQFWHCPLAGTEECDFECPGHPAEDDEEAVATPTQEAPEAAGSREEG